MSLSAGLPTFLGLCKHVVQELAVPASSNSRNMLQFYDDATLQSRPLPPLDQVFNELQQEYGSGEIDYLVSRRLKPKRGATLVAHETILRLSRSAHGNPQIVTTNFDYLFEKASKPDFKTFKSPALPDLTSRGSLDSLVYLHGRINGNMRRGDGPQGFVLSSSDFGRAYLAEGWATRFVRDLLDRYTVVLLGYSASDPPVRYLLQGLHTRVHGQTPSIYAFDHGSDDEVRQRWQDSGVAPLAYVKTDKKHSALWSTLEAWADRADDPMKWRRSTVQLAQGGPRSLTPEQRGQVVSILRTDVGAKLFADSDPPPPAEWICVFDSNIRLAEPRQDFSPLAEYGLDDDPPRPVDTNVLLVPGSVGPSYDLIRLQPEESQRNSLVRLAGIPRRWADPLSPRLHHLSAWIGKVLHDPVIAWWASRYETLHPAILAQIEGRLERDPSDLPAPAREVWLRLIEIFRTVPAEESDDSWHDTTTRIRAEGWTSSVLRSFARATQPYATARPALVLSASARPPGSDWPEDSSTQVVFFEVKFPPDDPIDPAGIPDEVIPRVYKILRGHLEWAADLLADIHPGQWWHTSTFYPENRPGSDVMLGGVNTYLHWFRSILDRLIELDPSHVKHDVALWPNDERFFFDKLRLYVWSRPLLIQADVVADGLLTTSDKVFWDFYNRRELLMLLKARWPDFSAKHRKAIENRIVDGDSIPTEDENEKQLKHRSMESATMLGWLLLQGLSLSSSTRQRLDELRSADPNWKPEWDQQAASSHDGGGGMVSNETDPSSLMGVPLDSVIQVATENTHSPIGELVSYRPFDGFVAARPTRAVSALTHASRRGDYPIQFWNSVLSNLPNHVTLRLRIVLAERIVRLPEPVILELRFELFSWAKNNLRIIARSDHKRSLRLLDELLDKLLSHSSSATQSSLGTRSIGGKPIKTSRRTFEHAINAPIGNCTQLALDILKDLKPDEGQGIPGRIHTRLLRLTQSPGEGRDHAVCIIAQAVAYLHWVDPDWTSQNVLPWFNLHDECAEAAWNGFVFCGRLPQQEAFFQIKPHFVALFGHLSGWHWDHQANQQMHRLLVQACFPRRRSQDYVSFADAKSMLQATDDAGRGHCLAYLGQILKEDRKQWPKFVRPFLTEAWPRELKYQTEFTSTQFARLPEAAGESFPQVVDTIFPLLTQVPRLLHVRYLIEGHRGNETTSIGAKYPSYALKLLHALVPDDPRYAPYQLEKFVNLIADSAPMLRQDPRWIRLHRIAVGI